MNTFSFRGVAPVASLLLLSSCILMHTEAFASTPDVPNALVITDARGLAHRIAIDGENLRLYMVDGSVRIANSGITVEYTPAETERFSFEHFDFGEALYQGSKEVVDTQSIEMSVVPVIGNGSIDEIRISAPGRPLPGVRTRCQEPLIVEFYPEIWDVIETVMSISSGDMASLAREEEGCYVITTEVMCEPGTYKVRIPAGYFEDSERVRNREQGATWILSRSEAGVEEVTSTVTPTVTLHRNGDILFIGGLGDCRTVTLYDIAGAAVATASVGTLGTAQIDLTGLNGVYVMHAGKTTLKITF